MKMSIRQMHQLSVRRHTRRDYAVKDALEESKTYLRHELAKRLNARKMPELIFKYDEALEYGNHMNEVISSLNIKHDDDNK